MFTFLSTLSLSLSVSLFPSLATFFHPQGSNLRLCKLSINISYSRKRQTTIGCTNTHNNCNNCLDFTPRSPAQCRRFGLVKCNNFYHTHKSDFLQRFVAQPAAATVSCFGQSRSKRERERDSEPEQEELQHVANATNISQGNARDSFVCCPLSTKAKETRNVGRPGRQVFPLYEKQQKPIKMMIELTARTSSRIESHCTRKFVKTITKQGSKESGKGGQVEGRGYCSPLGVENEFLAALITCQNCQRQLQRAN